MPHLNDVGQRVVEVRLLRDRSGRTCIHWFQRRPDGPITTPAGAIPTNQGPLQVGGVRGRIVCQPERKSDLPVEQDGVTRLLMRSDDVRAVTCPDCRATKEYWQEMVAISAAAGTELTPEETALAEKAGVSLTPVPAGGA